MRAASSGAHPPGAPRKSHHLVDEGLAEPGDVAGPKRVGGVDLAGGEGGEPRHGLQRSPVAAA